MAEKVYIVAAKRTAVGSFLGTLKGVHPSDLGAPLIQHILKAKNLEAGKINEVIIGNILPAGAGQGIARQVSIKGGIPKEVPAYSLNMACGSAMKAIFNAYQSIRSGTNHLVFAGGVESMSRAPFITAPEVRTGMKMGDLKLKDHMIYDALTDAFNGVHMGVTAENIAEKYGITRQTQDAFAWASQQKAIAAVDSGVFQEEIVPLNVAQGKEIVVFDKDEYPNRTTNLEKLAKLKPAFKENGSVTAGNASGINDGGSMTLVASEHAVAINQLTPLVEIVGIGQGGVDPLYMGLGPTPAVKQALKQAKLTLKDIQLIELNEAFAAQALGVVKELSDEYAIPQDQILAMTNVHGGAIALGHAVGSSGARIVVTLIHEMIRRKVTYGLATLCIGGGMGTAIVLKRI